MRKNVFVLDNNDSFTYNIVNYLRKMSGVSFDVKSANAFQSGDLAKFDKIIISPGLGLPADFPIISEILERYHRSKPILGICMGHQAIGTYFGGELANLSPVIHGQAHEVHLKGQSSLWKGIPEVINAGLYHSWTLNAAKIPDTLRVTAVSATGAIMAIQAKEFPVFGVQFHPESHISEYGFEILNNFVAYDDK